MSDDARAVPSAVPTGPADADPRPTAPVSSSAPEPTGPESSTTAEPSTDPASAAEPARELVEESAQEPAEELLDAETDRAEEAGPEAEPVPEPTDEESAAEPVAPQEPDAPQEPPATAEAEPEAETPTVVPTPTPTPTPGPPSTPRPRGPLPGPTPAPAPGPAATIPGPPPGPAPTPTAAPASFGRVAEDGTVFVRTADGERSVGQVPDAEPAEAMAFFVRRYEALELEVTLLERRIASTSLSPDDALSAVRTVRSSLVDAHAVGDLPSLSRRLDALAPVVGELRSARKAERAKQSEETRAAKEKFVAEAEKLAAGNDWRGGVNRFRQLLDQWKLLPRLDRTTDDALWHRFSSARTTYTRRRKAQFAQQAEHRDGAQKDKEKIIAEAEGVVDSTDWGPTTGVFRDLMTRWKAAGPAPRNVDEQLWRKFRELQDRFFAAKNAAQGEQDAEFKVNQEAKEALLVEGEKLVPVTDLERSRAGYRDLVARWAEIGKVPRDAIRPLETRMRSIETAIKSAEEDLWRRTNPEARARAEDTASKLSAQIAEQEDKARKAENRGDAKAAKQANDAAETYRSWLEQAHRAIDDFTV